MDLAPHVTARAEEILARVRILANPYLTSLRDGSMSLEAFRETQRQFYFAVEFFSRPMAGLVARIPDPHLRLDILHNVVEEHGEFDHSRFHETTFRAFLGAIGDDVRLLDTQVLWPEVRAFNSVLATACVHDELEVGVACMGIIEHAFAGISAAIGRAVVDRGWCTEAELVHYALHEQIDERHATEFYKVIEPLWGNAPRRYFIEQGLELGAYVFNRLYQDLHGRSRVDHTRRLEPL